MTILVVGTGHGGGAATPAARQPHVNAVESPTTGRGYTLDGHPRAERGTLR